MWYHVAPFNNSPNVDIWAVYLTGLATILLLLIPFIPGLRDIPRYIPLHRLIWPDKDYGQATVGEEAPVGTGAASQSS